VSRTPAFESRLLLLDVFEVDVLEILRQFVLYAMIGNKQENKINKTVYQIEDYQQYDAMAW
jgi:hypothetical protein